ncbi:MAG: hypothetical protein JXD22_09660 [Sedimentisphaerales bacterium]|nr:hypothetical protein [Sedimentisphaerales bacterium]
MKNSKKILLFLIVLLLAGFATAQQQQQQSAPSEPSTTSAKPVQSTPLPISLLDAAYVDIRNGFSVRPPLGSQLATSEKILVNSPTTDKDDTPDNNDTVKKTDAPESTDTPDSTGITDGNLPNLIAGWDLLKFPESKELVRFHHASTQRTLVVYLLAAKRKSDIEKVLQARLDFWKKFSKNAQVQSQTNTQIKDQSAALLTVNWLGDPSQPPQQIVRETIIQAENKRFFLLALIEANPDQTVKPSIQALAAALIRNFTCFGKTEESRRWLEARKNAQAALENLKFSQAKLILCPPASFRILRDAKDIGFYLTSQSLDDQAEKSTISLKYAAFVNNSIDAQRLLRLLGWARSATSQTDENPPPAGSYSFNAEFILNNSLRSENFSCKFINLDNRQFGHTETGSFINSKLNVQRFDDPQNPDKVFSESLKADERLFLTSALAQLLPRMMTYKINDEFVFQLYNNRSVRYHFLHVAGISSLNVAASNKSTDSPNNGTETPTNQNSDNQKTQEIKTYRLVSQTGPDGPIVETWIDEKGNLLKLQANNGLTLLRCTTEKINELWPEAAQKTSLNN